MLNICICLTSLVLHTALHNINDIVCVCTSLFSSSLLCHSLACFVCIISMGESWAFAPFSILTVHAVCTEIGIGSSFLLDVASIELNCSSIEYGYKGL